MSLYKVIGLSLAVFASTLALVVCAALHVQPLSTAPPSPPPRSSVATSLAPPSQPPPSSAWTRYVSQKAVTPPLTMTDNILLAGLDTRPGWRSGRTDALVVAVLDRRHGHAGLVSVPRDLLVSVEQPGDEQSNRGVRINTIYQRAGGGKAGAAALRRAVGGVLGLEIAQVVMVDHAGFEALIDELGGVSVLVRCPLVEQFIDGQHPDGHRMLRLTPGLQQMDGATALMFARARHGRGIYDRARRQQALLDALRSRLLGIGLNRARQLLPALDRAVFTDMTTLEILQLARRVSKLDKRRVHGLVIDSRHARPTTINKRWVLVPDPPRIHTALAKLFSASVPGKRRWRSCPPADAGFRARANKAARLKLR